MNKVSLVNGLALFIHEIKLKMKIILWVSAISTFCIIACKSTINKERNYDAFQKIEINNTAILDTVQIDSFLSFKRIIKLDTSVQASINRINKLRKYNGKYYIMDLTRKGIKIFDSEGRFLRSFHMEGGGPGEYLFLSDFEIHPQSGDLYILDSRRKTLLVYDGTTLSFLRKIELPVNAINFHFVTNSICAFYTGLIYNDLNMTVNSKKANRFFLINVDTGEDIQIVTKGLEFPADGREYANAGVFQTFYIGNDNICFAEAYNNLVYTVTPDSILPRYEIVFKINNLPPNSFLEYENIEKVSYVDRDNKSFYYFNFLETKQYILGIFWQNDFIMFIYDKKTKTSKCTRFIKVGQQLLNWLPKGLYCADKKAMILEIPQQNKTFWDSKISSEANEENPWLAEFELK